MTAADPAPLADSAARALRSGQHVLFALLWAIGLSQSWADHGAVPAVVAGSLLLAAWYAAGAWLSRRLGPRGAWVWFAVLAVGWVVLVLLAPTFAWLVFALNLLALQVLPDGAALGTVVALTLTAISVLWPTASNPLAAVLGPTMGAVVAVGVSWGYQRILAESAERGRLLGELTAAQADLVAVQSELATVQRETGALAERSRLARDIHDTLAQGYSSILLLARAGLARGASEADLLGQIESTAAENLEEARRVVHALAPAQLEDAPLPAAVRRLVERLAAETGIRAELEVVGDPRLAPTDVDVAVLRLVQGALANVRQHARAGRVRVSLSYEPTELLVDVVDDGRGFDPAAVGPGVGAGGFGLRAMRERLAEFGGTLSVESEPGEGTAVAASIPWGGHP